MVRREGATFSGYRLVQSLGRGGAGTVYLAEPPTGGAAGRVALKVFDGRHGEPTILDMLRQGQAVAALEHPRIVPCYGDIMDGMGHAIVMEYIESGSLGDTLAAGPAEDMLPLRPATVLPIIQQSASILADVHAYGLSHGDLKPTNLFVRTDRAGSPVVAIGDFGHAFLARAAVAMLSQGVFDPPLWVVDQLTWTAPEQFGEPPVAASDQYSLAAIAYYLLTGVHPVSAHTQSLLQKRGPRPITPPSRLNDALGAEVDAVLLHALSPVPQRRFADIAAFASALESALMSGYSGDYGAAPMDAEISTRSGIHSGILTLSDLPTGSSSALRRATHAFPGRLTLPTTAVPRAVSHPESFSGQSGPMLDDLDDLDELDDAEDEDEEAMEAVDEPLPEVAVAASKRRHAIVRLGIVAALLLCGVAVLIGSGRLPIPASLRGLGGGNPANVATATLDASSAQTTAEKRLRAALAHTASYSDGLTGTPADWTVNDKSLFFGSDHRLHLHNTAKTPLFDDMPAKAPLPSGAYMAQVSVAFVSGTTSVHAGMRFLVSKAASGENYYSFLITPGGRFELWLQQPSTGPVFLTSGTVASLTTGMEKPNTLAVLIDPAAKTLTLFANGAFLYQSPIDGKILLNGRLGLVTPDSATEAAFTDFTIYPA